MVCRTDFIHSQAKYKRSVYKKKKEQTQRTAPIVIKTASFDSDIVGLEVHLQRVRERD